MILGINGNLNITSGWAGHQAEFLAANPILEALTGGFLRASATSQNSVSREFERFSPRYVKADVKARQR
jgi:hypothetical protein